MFLFFDFLPVQRGRITKRPAIWLSLQAQRFFHTSGNNSVDTKWPRSLVWKMFLECHIWRELGGPSYSFCVTPETHCKATRVKNAKKSSHVTMHVLDPETTMPVLGLKNSCMQATNLSVNLQQSLLLKIEISSSVTSSCTEKSRTRWYSWNLTKLCSQKSAPTKALSAKQLAPPAHLPLATGPGAMKGNAAVVPAFDVREAQRVEMLCTRESLLSW